MNFSPTVIKKVCAALKKFRTCHYSSLLLQNLVEYSHSSSSESLPFFAPPSFLHHQKDSVDS